MSRPLPATLTAEEYLAFEERQEGRHELVAGAVFAMVGGTRGHNRLANAVSSALLLAARGGPCRVYQQGMKLQVDETTVYYPDVMVACGEEPEDDRIERDPCLLVEVLSPSTASTDRREKRRAYLNLPSLRAYLLLDPLAPRAELHTRTGSGAWHASAFADDDIVDLPCLPYSAPLSAFYVDLR